MSYSGQDATPGTLIPQIERIEADAVWLTAGLSPAQLHWRPPDGGWSVAQALEHVTMGNRLYLPVLRRLLDGAVPPQNRTPKPWRPSFFGRLLIGALLPTNERKIRTSRRLKPGPQPGPNALDQYLATWHELTDVVRRSEGLDLNRMRMTSPVNSIVRRLNFGDALVILVVHGQRHLKQAERIKASPGFPQHDAT